MDSKVDISRNIEDVTTSKKRDRQKIVKLKLPPIAIALALALANEGPLERRRIVKLKLSQLGIALALANEGLLKVGRLQT